MTKKSAALRVVDPQADENPSLEQRVEDLRSRLNAEQDALSTAAAYLITMESRRRELLLADDATDDALARHDDELAAAKRAHDRHVARVEVLETQLREAETEAEEAAQRAEQRRQWEEYKAIVEAGHAAQARYPERAMALVDCLIAIEAADMIVAKANANCPEGEEPLVAPTSTRNRPYVPERTERVQELRWVDQTGRPIGAIMTNEHGEANAPGARQALVEVDKVIPRDLGWQPAPLYKAVSELPGLHRGDKRFWPR